MGRLVIAIAFLASACSTTPTYNSPSPSLTYSPPSTSISTPSNTPPGAYNPAVTQDTINQTICVVGWTKTIRVRLATRKGYQHDHFIPLELGGAPTNPNNLWYVPIDRAHRDDSEENKLHREVCSGKITLFKAQRIIIEWKTK